MDTGPPDYARQKFCEAVNALIGASPIDWRLTYAAGYLMFVQPRDLPAGMRDDFQKWKRKLTRIPLSSATSNMPRPISEEDAVKLAKTIPQHVRPVIGRLGPS